MLALIGSPYAKTPDAVYSVFHHVKARVPSARYGGAYVRKPGFHASVEDNLASWPSNYSVREAINRRDPRTVTRALDITLSDSDMRTLTRRLADAVRADDPRLEGLREFFGTLDGDEVYGRSRLGPDTAWYASSADDSHLWHIHLSFFTPFADDWSALAGIVSVLIGESLDEYLGGTMERIIAEHGDSGMWVAFVQRYLHDEGAKLTRDGRWGDETTAAAKWVFVNRLGGSAASYNGRAMTDWILRELIRRDQDRRTTAAIAAAVAKLPTATAPTQAQVDAAVAKFFAANPVKVPTGVRVEIGTVSGTLTGAGE
ncbi:hypothetical protein [Glycomyces sp. NPDC048151]|uniref:hypothetical protein n=1 Tax=Glycomyces sp. NPDC048151 TaxID=3364002 RepID=UPI0037160C2F